MVSSELPSQKPQSSSSMGSRPAPRSLKIRLRMTRNSRTVTESCDDANIEKPSSVSSLSRENSGSTTASSEKVGSDSGEHSSVNVAKESQENIAVLMEAKLNVAEEIGANKRSDGELPIPTAPAGRIEEDRVVAERRPRRSKRSKKQKKKQNIDHLFPGSNLSWNVDYIKLLDL